MTTYHYTYVITNLKPTDNEQFYIGVRSCHTHPALDNKYMGSGNRIKEAIKLNPHNFSKRIIKVWSTLDDASSHEEYLHHLVNAAQNPEYYNRHNANSQFRVTTESIDSMKKTKNDPIYKATKGVKAKERLLKTIFSDEYKDTKDAAAIKRAKTISDPEWQKNVNVRRNKQHSESKQDPKWKSTIGVEQVRKLKETIRDSKWKETVGVEQVRKQKETKQDPKWKSTIGVEQVRKRNLTMNTAEWISENMFNCEFCGNAYKRAMYNRWHGTKCKSNPLVREASYNDDYDIAQQIFKLFDSGIGINKIKKIVHMSWDRINKMINERGLYVKK